MSQKKVSVFMGGTGANSATAALTNLGAAPAIAYTQANNAYGAANNAVLKTGDTMTGQLNISSGGLLVTGNVGIRISDTANASLTVFGDSADPFNTPINILKLVTSAGNQGSSARIDMQVGSARPYIEALVTGSNSGSGASLSFATANTTGVGVERFRIDSSGRFGFGVTPSDSPTGSMFVLRSISGTATTPFNLYHNARLNVEQSADIFINNGFASRYLQTGGNHTWQTSTASGTAGGVITFNTGMTLDASGNVGVGTTSPTGRLTVEQNTGQSVQIRINNSSQTDQYLTFNMMGSTAFGITDWVNSAVIEAVAIGAASGAKALYFSAYNGPIIFATNARTERARISSGGSFSITQTPGQYTIDTAGGATSIANGGTVDFSVASGMLVVNDWTNGGITLYLCGGGGVTVVSSVVGQVGTFAYNAGVNGYTWTNNTGTTRTFGFFFVRTRSNA